MVGMKWRIWIQNQEESSLSRKIYEEGKMMGWPGLGREVSAICNSIGIPDVNEEFVPSKTIKSAVFEHHYSEMMSKITGYKKLEPIAMITFEISKVISMINLFTTVAWPSASDVKCWTTSQLISSQSLRRMKKDLSVNIVQQESF